MSALEVLGRTLADMKDRDSWATAHADVIGSYQAGAFAKAESVETYVRQCLTTSTWQGDESTDSGNRWEPLLLAWAGAEPNSLLVHHPDERQFGATVDGSIAVPRPGDAEPRFVIVETKAKHKQIVEGPNPREIRQMAWQLFCIPEAVAVHFVWGELVGGEGAWDLRRDPQTIVYGRGDLVYLDRKKNPVDAMALVESIGRDVLAGLRAARELEKELAL